MKILNFYAQEMEHSEARIVGNKEGLLALKAALERALAEPGEPIDPHPDQEPLFASDGEGFDIIVERHDDRWEIDPVTGKEDPASFWSKPESRPQYLYKERAVYAEKQEERDNHARFIEEAIKQGDKPLPPNGRTQRLC